MEAMKRWRLARRGRVRRAAKKRGSGWMMRVHHGLEEDEEVGVV